jgi:hypothetical protein
MCHKIAGQARNDGGFLFHCKVFTAQRLVQRQWQKSPPVLAPKTKIARHHTRSPLKTPSLRAKRGNPTVVLFNGELNHQSQLATVAYRASPAITGLGV